MTTGALNGCEHAAAGARPGEQRLLNTARECFCATAYRPRGETPLVFGIFDQQGLMASLSIDGTKISRIKR